MRGDRTGTIGFLDELFGFGASGSGLIGIGVDIGIRDRGIIRLSPDSPGCSCNRWPGLFGPGQNLYNCSGSGSGSYALIRISPRKAAPESSERGCPIPVQLFVILEVQTRCLDLPVRVVRFKKIKVFFVVDQGSNGCYNIVRQQPLAACCGTTA